MGLPEHVKHPCQNSLADRYILRGPPGSSTTMPRARPWVGFMAMPRTTWASRMHEHLDRGGRIFTCAKQGIDRSGNLASKRMSTTLPLTATIAPLFGLAHAFHAISQFGMKGLRFPLSVLSGHEPGWLPAPFVATILRRFPEESRSH